MAYKIIAGGNERPIDQNKSSFIEAINAHDGSMTLSDIQGLYQKFFNEDISTNNIKEQKNTLLFLVSPDKNRDNTDAATAAFQIVTPVLTEAEKRETPINTVIKELRDLGAPGNYEALIKPLANLDIEITIPPKNQKTYDDKQHAIKQAKASLIQVVLSTLESKENNKGKLDALIATYQFCTGTKGDYTNKKLNTNKKLKKSSLTTETLIYNLTQDLQKIRRRTMINNML